MTPGRPLSARPVRCVECGQTITKNNLRTHVKAKHPRRMSAALSDLFVEVGESLPLDAVPAEVPSPPPGPPSNLPAVRDEDRPALPPLGIDDLDDIVLAVVGQVAEPTGAVPVEFLPAVFAWREATASFLRTVGGS